MLYVHGILLGENLGKIQKKRLENKLKNLHIFSRQAFNELRIQYPNVYPRHLKRFEHIIDQAIQQNKWPEPVAE